MVNRENFLYAVKPPGDCQRAQTDRSRFCTGKSMRWLPSRFVMRAGKVNGNAASRPAQVRPLSPFSRGQIPAFTNLRGGVEYQP